MTSEPATLDRAGIAARIPHAGPMCLLDGLLSWTNDEIVCRAGNPYALPAKDRSGRLGVTEPPDLGALLAKINGLPEF